MRITLQTRILGGAAALALLLASGADARRFYNDDPLEREPAPRRVEDAKFRKLSDYYDFFSNLFAKMGEQPEGDEPPAPARAVNTLGEPMESAWWRKRHYYHPMSVEELKAGVGKNQPPATGGKWIITAAKSEGVTPGFYIQDSQGIRFVLKFDPISHPEMATGADVITAKLFHAAGYNVPEYYIVHFTEDQLKLGDDVELRDALGKKRKMTHRDVTELLLDAPKRADGAWRAIASRWLDGQPLGPFKFYDTRDDDVNDTVPHEHRRDLRGYKVFCSWVNHDDSRAVNTLDMLVKEGSQKYVKHYLIDFGSTLGSGTQKPNAPRNGYDYIWNPKEAARQFFSLGIYLPKWARKKYPGITAVGNFESKVFEPLRWVPEYPNPAFVNCRPEDGFWGAKQVMAFNDEQIRAIVSMAEYSDPRATEYIAKHLAIRRDKIGRAYFAQVLPLDKFTIENGELRFSDLEIHHKFIPSRNHAVQWSAFDNESETKTKLTGETSFRVPPVSDGNFVAADISAPDRKGKTVTVYIRNLGGKLKIVGIDRAW